MSLAGFPNSCTLRFNGLRQFSTVILLHLCMMYVMYTNCTRHSLDMVLTRRSASLFQQNVRLVNGKITPDSPFSFRYREGKLTSWRFWVTLQLIHKVPFFRTSYRQFGLFSYIYSKNDFRKTNIFVSPTYVFVLILPHHWVLLPEDYPWDREDE